MALNSQQKERKLRFLLGVFTVASILVILQVVNLYYGYHYYKKELQLMEVGPKVKELEMVKATANRLGIPYDGRQKTEVIRDLLKQGVAAAPYWPIEEGFGETKFGGEIETRFSYHEKPFLLSSSLSYKDTVTCNERGNWWVYKADRYGFVNPDALWDLHSMQIAFVGDSFTQGSCVGSELNFPTLIRKTYPHTLNLGQGSSGPLAYLANIKEYVQLKKPKVVFFVFYEGNDLLGDNVMKKNKLLMRYLEPGFTQNLASHKLELDKIVEQYIDDKKLELSRSTPTWKPVTEEDRSRVFWYTFGIKRWLYYSWLRTRLMEGRDERTPADYDLFSKVVAEANRTVKSWGGKFVFIYLPSGNFKGDSYLNGLRKRVPEVVQAEGIAYMDMLEPMVKSNLGTEYFFDFPSSHYSKEGYQFVADRVLEFLSTETSLHDKLAKQ